MRTSSWGRFRVWRFAIAQLTAMSAMSAFRVRIGPMGPMGPNRTDRTDGTYGICVAGFACESSATNCGFPPFAEASDFFPPAGLLRARR
jgi:hypothetical protein